MLTLIRVIRVVRVSIPMIHSDKAAAQLLTGFPEALAVFNRSARPGGHPSEAAQRGLDQKPMSTTVICHNSPICPKIAPRWLPALTAQVSSHARYASSVVPHGPAQTDVDTSPW